MIETYSKNITVPTNTAIPFNNVALVKGCTAQKQSPTTVQFNKAGVYEVIVSASANAEAAGDISIQLQKDNVVQPQTISTVTAADTATLYTLGFTTLVQVSHNNCNCNCAISPVTIQVINTGQEATFDTIDMVITKIC